MEIVASLTEQTTAATDLILGLEILILAGVLRQYLGQDRWRTRIWQGVLLMSGAVALAGTVAHGLVMPRKIYELLWLPMLLCLGFVVAAMVLAALYDLKGQARAKKSLPWLAAMAIGFFGITRIPGASFLWFILYEMAGMLFALGVYTYLAAKNRLPGAGTIALGIVLQMAAAGIQASGPFEVRLIWLFDHNGIFHIAGMIATLVMVFGAARGFRGAGR